MSSVHHLREFISDRLTAAASEIFSQFEKTILRYEEEIDRQRRLLDVSWRPELKLHRVDLQQELVHTTELILTDQHLFDQEMYSSLDQEEPEPPQIKKEQELCTDQDEDQLHPKQETDPFMVTSFLFEEPEPESDVEQLISQSSAGPEDQDSGSKKTNHSNICHGNKADRSATSERWFPCKICGKMFIEHSFLIHHIEVHRVRNQNSHRLQYCCPTCGKKFPAYSNLAVHMRSHTGEKPFSCQICGKRFSTNFDCKRHMMIHTGEKPYFCTVCGKRFNRSSLVKSHMNVHSG